MRSSFAILGGNFFAVTLASVSPAIASCDDPSVTTKYSFSSFAAAAHHFGSFGKVEKSEFETTDAFEERRSKAFASFLPVRISEVFPVTFTDVYDADTQTLNNLQTPNEFDCTFHECSATLDLFPTSSMNTTFIKLGFVGGSKQSLFPPLSMGPDQAREILNDKNAIGKKKYGFRWTAILDPVEPYYTAENDYQTAKTFETRTFYVKLRCVSWSVKSLK